VPYTTWVDGHVLSAADMTAITFDPQQADTSGSSTTTSTSYTDLAAGAANGVTLSLVTGQAVLVIVSGYLKVSAGSGIGFMGYAISGAATVAPADVDAAATTNTQSETVSRASVYIASTSGSFVFVPKFKVVTAVTLTVDNRRIIAKKF
jgi:hypothetical protein